MSDSNTPTKTIPGATNVSVTAMDSPGSSDAGLAQLLGDALHPAATVVFSAPTNVTLPE